MLLVKLILTAVDEALANAWQVFCSDVPDLVIHHGSILDVTCDAVVSPANSFGFLDGGVDAVYRRHFGAIIQARLQQAIQEHHHGELLVGAAEMILTDDVHIPYLIAAPTMRVPMILRDSANVYLAARALFLLLRHGVARCGPAKGQPIRDLIETVAMPGFGTGVGQVSPSLRANVN